MKKNPAVQYNFKNMPNFEQFLENNNLNQEVNYNPKKKLINLNKNNIKSTEAFKNYL